MPAKSKSKTTSAAPVKASAEITAKAKAAKEPKPAAAKSAAAKPPATAKVKAVRAAARATGAKAKPTAMAETYYVFAHLPVAEIASGQPGKGTAAAQFASFAEAKERAIDQLIELIEGAERRLHATRRAASFADYEQSLAE